MPIRDEDGHRAMQAPGKAWKAIKTSGAKTWREWTEVIGPGLVRQQDTAFGNIKGRVKTRRSLIKPAEARRQPFDRRGRTSPHRGRTICFSALAFAARD
jgi:hypothetical protein